MTIHEDHVSGESLRRWRRVEENELLRFIREWRPQPAHSARLVVAHANFVTAYHLSLDLNQAANLREHYRDEAFRLAMEIRYSRA